MTADRDTVRLLSAWLVALRDLTSQVEQLTAFGPTAPEHVARRRPLVEELQDELGRTWAAYAAHCRAEGLGRAGLRAVPEPRD